MPGEFTKRSFINGKISLDGAEGVIDVINAQTESEARAGFDLVNGELFKTVKTIQKSLTDMLAEIEVSLDYPEHDIEYETAESINVRLIEIKDKLNKLLETSKQGKIIKEGVNVVILGKPNVGKSSLMNALLNYDRAIVTEVAGTTRDTLQESYVYKDMKVNITDTAGIHESEDIVEKIGIEKAKESINNADIILLVLDGSKELSKEDKENIELIKGKRAFVIINKSDLEQKIKVDLETINISAKNKDGIDSIKEKIYQTVTNDCFVQSDIILTNKRHEIAVKDALNCIETAINNIFDISLDCVSVDIKSAWEKLGEITGETTSEDIIDAIFSKFCLGK
jgi:tRNA modification GTPase